MKNLKALFLTTPTNDVNKLVGAWDCWNEMPAQRWIFNDRNNTPPVLSSVKGFDVVFYVGSCGGAGNPDREQLRHINLTVPSIHICCDAGDKPWWQYLNAYRQDGCFTKQVGIDGHHDAPVDLVTLTPVDLRPYKIGNSWSNRTHTLGFPGNAGSPHRKQLVKDMNGILKFRERTTTGPYTDYVGFLHDCKMILNSALSGTANTHHVKGRVLEAAFAGCGLLEMDAAPTREFIPEELFRSYDSSENALVIAQTWSLQEEKVRASELNKFAFDNYHPKLIFEKMLEGIY